MMQTHLDSITICSVLCHTPSIIFVLSVRILRLYFVHIILVEGFVVQVKVEADSNDITEHHPHYEQPGIGVFGFSDKLFFTFIFCMKPVVDVKYQSAVQYNVSCCLTSITSNCCLISAGVTYFKLYFT